VLTIAAQPIALRRLCQYDFRIPNSLPDPFLIVLNLDVTAHRASHATHSGSAGDTGGVRSNISPRLAGAGKLMICEWPITGRQKQIISVATATLPK